ncbi:MAG: aromatic hydrocarbon degradation protein [Lentimicrobiaceae bacterium]|jgi:long-subunit fatty acid transport protein|nr:aromatic hydrocarbon degradation protein [Lentimicrobiaceae bacterium]MDD4598800.1 aromatic hydrocarbon degradation protein [Lentimicrobiaceae bacterium]
MMKKTLLALSLSALALASMAGGIVHNTNQSASFIRMPARDASMGLDGVYYNPAGLTWLKQGFHISVNNQYIVQNRNIKTTFPNLNRSEFEGGVVAPFFPSVYAVYKMDKFAFSFGFNPIGGGGSARFEDGLPSFEMQMASIPAGLNRAGIPTSEYTYETEFEGSSIYYGIQAGASYQVNDILSVSLGLRYVMINNSYEGYLSDIMINPTMPAAGFSGAMVKAPDFFNTMAGLFGALAGTAASLQPLIDGGGANLTLQQAQQAGYLTSEQVASIAGGFRLIDPATDPMTLSLAQIQGGYTLATPGFLQQQDAMSANALATADKKVDAEQTGSGIVPIIGANLKFERLNIGLKYEHKASIKVKNSTSTDDTGLYPDAAETPSDMPSMLSVGAAFDATSKLKVSAGLHYYFDKGAEYGKKLNGEFVKNDKVMDNNFFEIGIGAEYEINEKWLVSLGYLRTQTGVMDIYQSDLSHSLSTNSIGGGLRFMATEKIGINVGVMNTSYLEATRNFPAVEGANPSYTETYNRTNFTAAIGVDISF